MTRPGMLTTRRCKSREGVDRGTNNKRDTRLLPRGRRESPRKNSRRRKTQARCGQYFP
ncbi:hypothetical protein PUN28_008452 [Cardiocondyla obscurior]|uniref:Uncharacterized protein n=1 Tax=Cardiocondyla obscurior TaxID=286306 RepID=A0AAW2FZT3_9HYME